MLGADASGGARRRPGRIGVVETWGERVGIGVANAINTFDPEEVVIGGGGARAGELLLEPADGWRAGYVVPGLGRRTRSASRATVLEQVCWAPALLAVHELAAVAPPSDEVPHRGGS